MLFRRMLTALGVAGLLVLAPTPVQAAGPSPEDAAFLVAAHQGGLAEIAAGRIAWQKTTTPEVKTVAGALMRDHIRLNAAIYHEARKLRVYLPSQPTPEQQSLIRTYEAAGADTFDEHFILTQLAAHRATMELISGHLEEDGDPSVKALARRAAPVIAAHHLLLREAAEAEGIAGYAGKGGRPTP
jgi:putative membrane protein